MSTLLSTPCGATTTLLFCLPAIARLKPLAAAIPGIVLAVNTYSEVKGGSILNDIPLPATAALGDKIATLYLGGNVSLIEGTTTIYTYDPVGDLSKVVSIVYDGSKWVLA